MQSPHDRLFTFTFRHPRHAAGWVRCALPLALALAIDWESLVPLRERFPGVRLHPHLADCAFVARLTLRDGRQMDVVLVIEHKSYDDPTAEVQLLRYAVHLARSLQQRPHEAPFVLAVLLRHGLATSNPDDAEDELLALLRGAQPQQQVFVADLTTTSEAELLARDQTALATLSQLCMKTLPHTPAAEVPACFDRWQHLMRAVDSANSPPDAPPLAPDAIDAIGWYALAVTDVDSLVLAETFARILHRNDTTIMSTLERTFQMGVERGHAEGHAEGHVEGQAHTLLRLLALRFGTIAPDVIERVRSGSTAELDRWTARVLDAPTLVAVLADDSAG